jgi:hypothetical protein
MCTFHVEAATVAGEALQLHLLSEVLQEFLEFGTARVAVPGIFVRLPRAAVQHAELGPVNEREKYIYRLQDTYSKSSKAAKNYLMLGLGEGFLDGDEFLVEGGIRANGELDPGEFRNGHGDRCRKRQQTT